MSKYNYKIIIFKSKIVKAIKKINFQQIFKIN